MNATESELSPTAGATLFTESARITPVVEVAVRAPSA
jgi:hypothetical protein